MDARIDAELELLKEHFTSVEANRPWFLVRAYALPADWIPSEVDVAFTLREGYPGVSPYGIYVPSGLRFRDLVPNNFKDPAPTQPPFDGRWAVFSWEANGWFPTADVVSGHNLLTWVRGFSKRFEEGA